MVEFESLYQVARMALWTSGTPSTRSACVSSTGTPPALPHWLSITMVPCSQSPPPTCTRKETSATRRTPSSSAKSQTLRRSQSESLTRTYPILSYPVLSYPPPLVSFVNDVLLLNKSLSSCVYKDHVQLQHMLICIWVHPPFNIRQLKDRLIENMKILLSLCVYNINIQSVTRQMEECWTLEYKPLQQPCNKY